MTQKNTLVFGIFPGSALGDTELRAPMDRPDKINQALDMLQGLKERQFIVRAYEVYIDAGDTVNKTPLANPAGYDRYLGPGRKLDLVIQYHSRSGDVKGYGKFIEQLIDHHSDSIATVQIGEEPNLSNDPNLDGAYPRIKEAVIAGVHTAKEKVKHKGYHIRVGCNTSMLFGSAASFFTELTKLGGEQFIDDLDYVGLDFFPDVFQPIQPAKLETLVEGLLSNHRQNSLVPAGLGHLPLIVTEHGWPTGPNRSPERQAEIVRIVIGVIVRNAEALDITGYTHHALRDAWSAGAGLFSQFGLMTDDYSPKPAFYTYRDLIGTWGS